MRSTLVQSLAGYRGINWNPVVNRKDFLLVKLLGKVRGHRAS